MSRNVETKYKSDNPDCVIGQDYNSQRTVGDQEFRSNETKGHIAGNIMKPSLLDRHQGKCQLPTKERNEVPKEFSPSLVREHFSP
mmetsp:Transcript_37459/g.42215  ORF Transcript_37459/g.42215 Transcript_37459/m.42215 type:complete len:85 (-) Transcript_37459:463-717(-)